MKVSKYIILAGTALMLLPGLVSAAQLEQIDLPRLPDAKLVTEINLPQGNILDSLAREYGQWLGMSALKQISAFVYDIGPNRNPQDILSFYEPSLQANNWKTMVRSLDNNRAAAILYNEQNGMLIIQVDPPGRNTRQARILRIFGQVDPSKVTNSDNQLPDLFNKMVADNSGNGPGNDVYGASKIPIGQPISIPPSDRLHIKATRSDIRARIQDRTTAEIMLASGVGDPGELTRVEDRLVLSLTPKLPVSELVLPGGVPMLLELTDGSLTMFCGQGAQAAKLSIVATGAPVTVEAFPLVSGTHAVRSVGGEVSLQFSAIQGGALNVEVTGKDLTVAIPRESSARIQASAMSGKVDNLTGLPPQGAALSEVNLQLGSGKADITLRTVSGNIRIRYSD